MRLAALVVTASLLTSEASQTHPLASLWVFLTSLWSGATTDEGCGMDPSGRCLPAAQPKLDGGCGMDPNGRCNPAS
jgi:hypothetical protein